MSRKRFLGLFKSKQPDKYKQKVSDHGLNNTVSVDDGISYDIFIKGNNNRVIITARKPLTPEQRKIAIGICGDNNTVIINDLRTADLTIYIGNQVCVNNVNLEIGSCLACVQATILCYQSNVPIKIGAWCLFSKNVVFRSGELPHKIYDITTGQDLDFSDGIFVGNHVWIGEGAFIMKHARIPDNSIVGAMSVVTKAFTDENIVIAGNPAKICKTNINWGEA